MGVNGSKEKGSRKTKETLGNKRDKMRTRETEGTGEQGWESIGTRKRAARTRRQRGIRRKTMETRETNHEQRVTKIGESMRTRERATRKQRRQKGMKRTKMGTMEIKREQREQG